MSHKETIFPPEVPTQLGMRGALAVYGYRLRLLAIVLICNLAIVGIFYIATAFPGNLLTRGSILFALGIAGYQLVRLYRQRRADRITSRSVDEISDVGDAGPSILAFKSRSTTTSDNIVTRLSSSASAALTRRSLFFRVLAAYGVFSILILIVSFWAQETGPRSSSYLPPPPQGSGTQNNGRQNSMSAVHILTFNAKPGASVQHPFIVVTLRVKDVYEDLWLVAVPREVPSAAFQGDTGVWSIRPVRAHESHYKLEIDDSSLKWEVYIVMAGSPLAERQMRDIAGMSDGRLVARGRIVTPGLYPIDSRSVTTKTRRP